MIRTVKKNNDEDVWIVTAYGMRQIESVPRIGLEVGSDYNEVYFSSCKGLQQIAGLDCDCIEAPVAPKSIGQKVAAHGIAIDDQNPCEPFRGGADVFGPFFIVFPLGRNPSVPVLASELRGALAWRM
jgi:hypothetical protein